MVIEIECRKKDCKWIKVELGYWGVCTKQFVCIGKFRECVDYLRNDVDDIEYED